MKVVSAVRSQAKVVPEPVPYSRWFPWMMVANDEGGIAYYMHDDGSGQVDATRCVLDRGFPERG
jgi:hypothetical protein